MARCLDDCYYMPLARNDRTGVSRWKVIIQTVASKALSFLEALTRAWGQRTHVQRPFLRLCLQRSTAHAYSILM